MVEIDPNADLEFDGELLVSQINYQAYRHIYALEGWFRRICLTAWMIQFGSTWRNMLDPSVRRSLENRVQRNRRRLYLGAESHDDLIWETGHHELIQLLTADDISKSVESLTGASAGFLNGKLDEVREIRNLLAHNRALSQRTQTILLGLLASLEDAVDNFKSRTLYAQGQIIHEPDVKRPFQSFISSHGDFIEYVYLPNRPSGRVADARLLLQNFSEHLDAIIAFCLNKSGDEFSILTPAKLTEDERGAIDEIFANSTNVWTRVPYTKQPAKYACSPKIWFYENQRPQL